MNSQAQSGSRLKVANHARGEDAAFADLSFETASSIAGDWQQRTVQNSALIHRLHRFTQIFLSVPFCEICG